MTRSQRKDDHVALALQQDLKIESDFNLVRYIHRGLVRMNYSDVDTRSEYLGRTFALPFYINAMTGGSNKTLETNRKLALLAKHFGLGMAVGSQHAALDDVSLVDSYAIVREVNPDGFIMANVSANASLEQAQRAVAMIQADALGIHINVAQEITMDEGDRDFAQWEDNIKAIVEGVDVPVIVKEVGFGMAHETVSRLLSLGVKHVDVSGHGGTNFIWIENTRSKNQRFDYLADWGISTVESLLRTKSLHSSIEILASGGVKTPLDVLKLCSLGAKGVGISGHFLKAAQLNEDEMMASVEGFIHDFKLLMVLVGAKSIQDLPFCDFELSGKLSHFNEVI